MADTWESCGARHDDRPFAGCSSNPGGGCRERMEQGFETLRFGCHAHGLPQLHSRVMIQARAWGSKGGPKRAGEVCYRGGIIGRAGITRTCSHCSSVLRHREAFAHVIHASNARQDCANRWCDRGATRLKGNRLRDKEALISIQQRP